jgi:hypothetical protein
MGRRPWSPSQQEVAKIDRLIADRKSNSAIGRALGVSAATIAGFLARRAGEARSSYLTEAEIKAAEAEPVPTSAAELALTCRAGLYSTLEQLVKIMRDPWQRSSARVAAAGEVLDRGHGRPSVEAGVNAQIEFFAEEFKTASPDEFASTCRSFTNEAFAVLRWICANGAPVSARIKAARMLIARGAGLAPAASNDPLTARAAGKKAQAVVDAATAGLGTEWGDDLVPGTPSPRRTH